MFYTSYCCYAIYSFCVEKAESFFTFLFCFVFLGAGLSRCFQRTFTRALSVTAPLNQGVPGPLWNLGRLNHIAIAVPDMDKATALYRDVLGAKVSEKVPLPEHGVYTVFVELGNTKLELLHPLGEKSPIAGFLQKNKSGGMHHICIEVRKQPLVQFHCDQKEKWSRCIVNLNRSCACCWWVISAVFSV